MTDGTNTALLSCILRLIVAEPAQAAQLALSTDALVSDGTTNAPFDFKYDSDGQKFGAGTAFLQD